MPISTGPIFGAFKDVLQRAGRSLDAKTEECSMSVIRLLEAQAEHHGAGMLLGKVQSGKTRAFVGAIAIGFDSGFDIAIVLTKTSKPLAAQTIKRLENDLAPALEEHRVRIFDAAGRIGPLNFWEQQRKLILVAKKHPKNLENVAGLLLGDEHPNLRNKRVLIVDDEADFASVGYQRSEGGLRVRRVQTLINSLREGLPNSVYLEVTATPYSLYLQPADIEEPATGTAFQGVRPAFTKRVPVHGGYVGGDFYFDKAQEEGSPASYVHVPVSDAELTAMRQPAAIADAQLLTDPNLASLRRALITFVVGGVLRRLDEEGLNRPERLFSFIVHLERLRGAHNDQQQLARRLIDVLRGADLRTAPVGDQVRAAYDDLQVSREAEGMATVGLNQLIPEIQSAFASITTEVVNSDAQLERLLDNSGQLRQRSPLNIYIGGQSLDRGVTIANVIGFFYGRDPRVAQQDTTIQHCRMYGARPPGDLAVTRFYTSTGIYDRMRRMHEFDKMLWEQLRVREEGGDEVYEPGDVVFLARDPSGEVSPCAASKIKLSNIQWASPGGELVPRPLTTVSARRDEPAAAALLDRLRGLGAPSRPFAMELDAVLELLDEVFSLVRIDAGWEWDFEAMKDATRYLAGLHPDADQRDRVFVLYTLDSEIKKWKDQHQTIPQNAPYTSSTEEALRLAAGRCPGLALYHNTGQAAGWAGSPFIWPVLFVPEGVPATVYANNKRRAQARPRQRVRRA